MSRTGGVKQRVLVVVVLIVVALVVVIVAMETVATVVDSSQRRSRWLARKCRIRATVAPLSTN